jgi:hypothetical protein
MFREVKLADFTLNDRFNKGYIDVPAPSDYTGPIFDSRSQKLSQQFYGESRVLSFSSQERTLTFRVNGNRMEIQEICVNGPEINNSLTLMFPSILIPSITFNQYENDNTSDRSIVVTGFDLWVVTEARTLHRIAFRAPNDTRASVLSILAAEFHHKHISLLLRRGKGSTLKVILSLIALSVLTLSLDNTLCEWR